jgi:hypothetical protein
MTQLRQFVEDFASLFAGNKNSYGVFIPAGGDTKEGEKAKGKSFTKTEPLAETLYLKHLHGEQGLGVVPITKEGKVSFAAIDVDTYPLNPVKYLTMLQKAKLPLVGFSSKSKGLHLYCFFNPPEKASDVITLMDRVRELIGLPKDTEIFPKQTQLGSTGSGNWINLPYFNAENTVRYAYSVDGGALPLSTALNLCMQLRTTTKALKDTLDSVPMAEAPPCLQTMFLEGGAAEGERNAFMLNCGVYLKARFGDAFADNLHLLNNNTLEPLDYIELDTTVVASLNKRDYNYACKSPLLKGYCNKTECGSRKYGVGGQYISDFEFGQLIRFKGDDEDEYYIWDVNATKFTLYGIQDLIKQDRFRALCGSKLNHIPNKLKEPVWLNIVNKALNNVIEEQDDISLGLSDKAHWTEKVCEFLSTRQAIRREQLLENLVYLTNGKLYFKNTTLQEYLTKLGTLNHVNKQQHMKFLKDFGVQYGTIRVDGKVMKFNYVELLEQHKYNRLLNVSPNPEREARSDLRAVVNAEKKLEKIKEEKAKPREVTKAQEALDKAKHKLNVNNTAKYKKAINFKEEEQF